MRYLTDRKRATGLGASGQGTHHHYQMLISSILMVVVVPLFVFTFGAGMGGTREEVIAYVSRPWPAIVTGLGMIVILNHVKNEAHEAIEDYVHGMAERFALIATSALTYTLMAIGLFALVKIAL